MDLKASWTATWDIPPRILEASRDVYPEEHRSAAMIFFSAGTRLRFIMSLSFAQTDRNSIIVG